MKNSVCLLLILFLLAACDSPEKPAGPVYGQPGPDSPTTVLRLAVHPLHNPVKLHQAYGPLVAYLEKAISDLHLELEASKDYASYETKIRNGKIAFLLPNPWQTLEAIDHGYEVLAMAGNPNDFKGIFILKKDSTIKDISDLKGKTVTYPAPTALAACIMPQYFLHTHGIDVNRDITNKFVGSQESAIQNVYLGHSAAGATWPPPWRAFQKAHPREAVQLCVRWETLPLVNNSFMARKNLPQILKQQVRKTLLQLHDNPEGRAILADMETERFHPADNASYDVVRSFIKRFEQEVRPVEDGS